MKSEELRVMNLRNPQFFTLNFSLLTSLSRPLLLLAMAVAVAGCSTPRTGQPQITEFVLPECDFVEERLVRQLDEAKRIMTEPVLTSQQPASVKRPLISDEAFRSDPEIRQFFKDAGAESELDKILSDPFWIETLPRVDFGTNIPGREVAEYYQAVFENAGWKKGRGIFPLSEGTLCNGDWLQVFVRGNKMVLVHVCGSMEKRLEETKDSFIWRQIILVFRGLKPEELLGRDFRKRFSIPMPKTK
ncbi:MAG: hypothetical protein WCV00_16835 [Verrucomicrobiia bacterium]